MFRDSGINKQINVPFIGAVMLCLKYNYEIVSSTTDGVIRLIKQGIDKIIADQPMSHSQKKEFLKSILGDNTLKKTKHDEIMSIVSEIAVVHNFINISDKHGRDTMNMFLKIFRK
jgi:putative N-acetylmannosamine-6-phosphate epimerase